MIYDLDTKEGMLNAMLWTRKLVDQLHDGGSWAIPRSGTVVTFNKRKQIAIVDAPFANDPSVTRVLKALGWKIVMK